MAEVSKFAELFPATRWETYRAHGDLVAQAGVVSEECGELHSALRKEGPARALEEAVDVMVAASGLVHRLAALAGTTPDEALAAVVRKNRARGYYPKEATPLEASVLTLLGVPDELQPRYVNQVADWLHEKRGSVDCCGCEYLRRVEYGQAECRLGDDPNDCPQIEAYAEANLDNLANVLGWEQ